LYGWCRRSLQPTDHVETERRRQHAVDDTVVERDGHVPISCTTICRRADGSWGDAVQAQDGDFDG
jgi:hypothetical protein